MQAVDELDWQPEYGLVEGLKDSWDKDFNRGTYRKEADFSTGERAAVTPGVRPLCSFHCLPGMGCHGSLLGGASSAWQLSLHTCGL